MRFKSEDFDRFADRIRNLSDDEEVAAAGTRLKNLTFERELLERKEEEYLRGLATTDSPNLKKAEENLLGWRDRRWELSRAIVAEYAYLRKRLNVGSNVQALADWQNVSVATLAAQLRLGDLAGCVTVERPSGLQFLHSWCSDDWNAVTLLGLGFAFGGPSITSLRYQIDLYGPIFMTLEATWGFIVPDANLCGFEVSSAMIVDGFVDAKASRTVTIAPAVHVRQYRNNQPLDQVEAGAGPLLSNIWGKTFAEGIQYGASGYVDGTYGLHSIPTIRSEVQCAYAYPTHTARVPVVAGDRLVVSSQLTLMMDAYTYVLIGDPRPQPTSPYYGGVQFFQPTVTFYTAG